MTTAPPRPTRRHQYPHDGFIPPRPAPPAWHAPAPVWDVPAGLALPPQPPAPRRSGPSVGTAVALAAAVLFAALGVWGVVALVGAVGDAGTRDVVSEPVATGVSPSARTTSQDTSPSAGSVPSVGTSAHPGYRNVTGPRGTTLTAGTMQLTAPKLQRVMYLGTVPTKCTTVTYTNLGSGSVWIGQLDWTLRSPSGATMSPTYADPVTELPSGYLDPGTTASGAVCFATDEALAGWDLLYASGHDSSAPTAVFTG